MVLLGMRAFATAALTVPLQPFPADAAPAAPQDVAQYEAAVTAAELEEKRRRVLEAESSWLQVRAHACVCVYLCVCVCVCVLVHGIGGVYG